LQVLSGINRSYPVLFGIRIDESSEDGSGEVSDFYSKWGWVAIINDMSNNDATKWNYFFKMNVTEFLNTVVFYKDKNEHDRQLHERAMRRNGNS
jgi:hypothetical protein